MYKAQHGRNESNGVRNWNSRYLSEEGNVVPRGGMGWLLQGQPVILYLDLCGSYTNVCTL